jgi:hypothetical protein
LNSAKVFDVDRFSKDLKREMPVKQSIPRSVNDFISKRNQTEGYLKTKMKISQENKSIEPYEGLL